MKSIIQITIAFIITALALLSGYLALGWLVMLIFAVGYFGGFLFWILTSRQIPFSDFKIPYWLTWAFFVFLHKPEEKYMKFFDAISGITGVPVPSITSIPVIMMLLVGVVPWLLIPFLVKKNWPLGYYLAWTFFTSMCLSELAHFLVFPFIINGPYTYFPGMASVIVLSPAAAWGMYKLAFSKTQNIN